MADISAAAVKQLREATGAGMLECKKALVETDGDLDKAAEYLRRKGLAKAAGKAGRIATEGAIVTYVHGGRIGVMVEVNCETDFVAKTEDFRQYGLDVAMQIAAMNPACVRREEMDPVVVEKEAALLRERALAEGKPEKILDKIVEGQLSKFFAERVLMEQAFIKENKLTIEELQKSLIAKLGENVRVRRFLRYELGEGLEKRVDDFAAEVAAQVRGT
jgi:elongation factor Ts